MLAVFLTAGSAEIVARSAGHRTVLPIDGLVLIAIAVIFAELMLVFLQLLHETGIGVYFSSFCGNCCESLLHGHAHVFHEVCYNEGGGPGNAGHAVDEDVGLFSGLVDEVSSSFEVNTQVVVFVVLAGDVQQVWYMLFGVLYVDVFAGSQQRADSMSWVK